MTACCLTRLQSNCKHSKKKHMTPLSPMKAKAIYKMSPCSRWKLSQALTQNTLPFTLMRTLESKHKRPIRSITPLKRLNRMWQTSQTSQASRH